MLRTRTLAVSLTMLVACAKADQPGPAKPVAAKPAAPVATAAGNSELENKGIAMMQQMGDLFAANAKDCDKLADGIKAFVAQNKALLAQLSALEKSEPDADKKAFEARNVGTQEEVMKKLDEITIEDICKRARGAGLDVGPGERPDTADFII